MRTRRAKWKWIYHYTFPWCSPSFNHKYTRISNTPTFEVPGRLFMYDLRRKRVYYAPLCGVSNCPMVPKEWLAVSTRAHISRLKINCWLGELHTTCTKIQPNWWISISALDVITNNFCFQRQTFFLSYTARAAGGNKCMTGKTFTNDMTRPRNGKMLLVLAQPAKNEKHPDDSGVAWGEKPATMYVTPH